MKMLMVGAAMVLVGLIPWSEASAGGYSGGGYRDGYWDGGYRGPRGGYRGGYRGGGCWNCDVAGAAIIGLGIGALLGAAIATPPPPVVVSPPPGPVWPRSCRAVVIDGVTYYSCDGYFSR
jgi:hypothetical protein